MRELSTNELESILSATPPEQLSRFLTENADELIAEPRPFTSFMRQMFTEHNMKPQDVFDRADLPQRYAYRIISGEKHTKQRDLILRLCFAAQMTYQQTQRALQIYGMSRLYARIPRDAVLVLAFQQGITDIGRVNALLEANGMQGLKSVSEK